MGNRRTNWANDLFIKVVVTIAASFIIISYNALTDFIVESSKFKGEMIQFKTSTENQIILLLNNDATFTAEQSKRTGNAAFSGGLKDGDAIKKICRACEK